MADDYSTPFAGAASVSSEKKAPTRKKRAERVTIERAENGFTVTCSGDYDGSYKPQTAVFPGGHAAFLAEVVPHVTKVLGLRAPTGVAAKDADD